MLNKNDVKEELSYAYVHDIASKAKFFCEPKGKDRDSIDAHIEGYDFRDGNISTAPQIDVQLKATAQLDVADEGFFSFPLSIKNYDDIRNTYRTADAILIVLIMPDRPELWLDTNEEELVARNSAYWCDIKGAGESENKTSQTVYIPRENQLTPESLTTLMSRVADLDSITDGRPEDRGVIRNG